MKCNSDGVRVERARYQHGKLSATVIVAAEGQPVQVVPVEISNVDQGRALSLVNAMGRLLLGAVVMDGQDLLAIRDSIDNARGLASALAPETADSTLVLASIERAHGQVRGVLAS
jgi:hypothetical protein